MFFLSRIDDKQQMLFELNSFPKTETRKEISFYTDSSSQTVQATTQKSSDGGGDKIKLANLTFNLRQVHLLLTVLRTSFELN